MREEVLLEELPITFASDGTFEKPQINSLERNSRPYSDFQGVKRFRKCYVWIFPQKWKFYLFT